MRSLILQNYSESRRGVHMLPYFLINVRQLLFWLKHIYDIKGIRNDELGDVWVGVMGKLGLFQCSEFLNFDGEDK